jgi:hypothetical protein
MMSQRSLAGNPLPACAMLLSRVQPIAGLVIAAPDSPDPGEYTAENANFSRTRIETTLASLCFSLKFRPIPLRRKQRN